MNNGADLEAILSYKKRLPTLPGIAMKILEAVQRERPDLKEIGEILATDPPLSAEVLRLINSSLYGLPRKVTSVFHAVNMLGINTVKNLALSFALVKQNPRKDGDDFNYPQFWKNSLTAAVASRQIAECVAPGIAEDMFFIGLLHDMGQLALACCLPDQYALVMVETDQSQCAQQDAENQILGFDHMAAGRHLFETWGLPDYFGRPVSCHHDPGKLEAGDAASVQMSHILHLATLYMELFQDDHQSAQLGLIDHYTRMYGFADILDVDGVGAHILDKTRQIFPFFDLTLENEKQHLEIIDRARAELIHVSNNFIDQLLEQQQQIQQLRRQATHDGLTQLVNYQSFHEALAREMARTRRSKTPLTVMMADIDRFKSINDTFGHLAGDQALQTVAGILKNGLRETDLIARYGGEEFAAIFYNIPPDETIAVADRLRQKICETSIRYDRQAFSLSMSFGIATYYPEDNVTKEELIDRADRALYQAKAEGRNCCRIYQHRLKCTAA